MVVADAGRVLLALWNAEEQHPWTLPGGGVELAETPAEGVVRAVRTIITAWRAALDGRPPLG